MFVEVKGRSQGAASVRPAGRSRAETGSRGVADPRESGCGQLRCRWRRAAESSGHTRQQICPVPLSG